MGYPRTQKKYWRSSNSRFETVILRSRTRAVREYLTCITPNPAKIIPVTSSVIAVVRVPQIYFYMIYFIPVQQLDSQTWTLTNHFSTNLQGHRIGHIPEPPRKYDRQATLLPWKLLLQLFLDAYIMVAQSLSLRRSDRGPRKWDGPEIERPWLVLCQNNDRFTEIKVRALRTAYSVQWRQRDLHQCHYWKCLSSSPSKILIITTYPCS